MVLDEDLLTKTHDIEYVIKDSLLEEVSTIIIA
ncbi:hypothetical protein LINGRAHAP2_LOCUS30011, partial [Linum grandiflorum]